MAKPKLTASKKPLVLLGVEKKKPSPPKRTYLSQTDVPAYTLAQAMRVPAAIFDHYAGSPTPPLRVASAVKLQPQSSTFRQMSGAAIAYGLTSGGYNSEKISVTPLAKRIFRPLNEDDDLAAKREAFLKPRIIGEFLGRYNGSKFPREDIAKNLLEDMGVPRDRTTGVLEILTEGASTLGLTETIKGAVYVHLGGASARSGVPDPATDNARQGEEAEGDPEEALEPAEAEPDQPANGGVDRSRVMRRVYITHGKNRGFLELLKKFLTLTELEPVLSVERESVAIPVPEKVMRDMRSCGAALIHVDEERQLVAPGDATVHNVLNPNVLIEIGAAMALYGKRFILLVKEGVKLPSNLQGIYELRYTGEALDAATTVRLLEAIAALKNEPLPSVWIEDA